MWEGEGKRRILIGQSDPPPFWNGIRTSLSPLVLDLIDQYTVQISTICIAYYYQIFLFVKNPHTHNFDMYYG
jgi:hypothetical protein